MGLSLKPVSDAIGVEALDIDLNRPIAAADAQALRNALAKHLLLIIRDQSFSPEQFVKAASVFGEPVRQHQSTLLMSGCEDVAVLDSRRAPILPSGKVNTVGSVIWHTDHTNDPQPPSVTCLYGVEMPKNGGGDTGFANMQMAFEKLPKDRQDALMAFKTVNTFRNRRDCITDDDLAKLERESVHPLIRTHPITGKKSIYVHWNQMNRLEEQEPEPSRKFIRELLDNTIVPDIIYRHKWCKGDFLLVDNAGAMHKGMRDYQHTETRILHRVILKGGVPYQ